MSTNFILNEPLMIRDRLQEAYKKIIFIVDNDFAQDANYKKAHQVLYARIKKLEESSEFDRPRAVKDVIPGSNLAKYGQYLYNEARERSYTSSVSDVSLHYPCLYKSQTITEPWMLPEVEQIFIHTVFTGSFNFKLYEAELEQLEKIDLIEETVPGLPPRCCAGDLHKVNPVMEQLFERAPGKSFGDRNEAKIVANVPYYFNVNDYADVLLRKNILSDVVRELWNKPKLENYDKLLKIYRSVLDNLYIEENHFKYVHCLKTTETERSLQKLVESIKSLNERVPQSSAFACKESDSSLAETTPPARRLYSDVVQGNKHPTIKQQELPETSSSMLLSSVEDFFGNSTLDGSSVEAQSPERTTPRESSFRIECNELEESCGWGARKKDSSNGTKMPTTPKYSYSDAVNNVPEVPASPDANMLLNDFPSLYDGSFRNGSSTSFQNFFTPLQYMPSTVYNASYRLGYTSTFTGTFSNQQVPAKWPTLSSSAAQQQQQQHQWFFPSYRPTSLCGYGNFLGQLLVPPIPTKHRWNNPHYGRPPTPQNLYPPAAQSWGMQSVYRSGTANQHTQISTYPTVYDAQKNNKAKKPTTTNVKFVRSKTPDPTTSIPKTKNVFGKKPSSTSSYPCKILAKPGSGSDYKLMTRHDGDVRPGALSSPVCDEDDEAAISRTASDDLEKIAIREYQSSANDLFFIEIERQAKEQYDGNPENSCCPPNKPLSLGGLTARRFECFLPLRVIGSCSFESRRYFIL